ncbi:hypothetical protein [Actinoplanes couchii]|uniref:Lipoprotein n=1 Tax=Actinoplanes couchii TaxID=403638 RepID=A0ABQ3XRN7_9ACTN|nr:hypothetical protein [Actinoplanes couchii]MDR6318882.1 hypothetical protein [Actinoplanes couchii]GID61179.1 hypothetical protein Aco03nite_095830 [Actinoplanes couchii]
MSRTLWCAALTVIVALSAGCDASDPGPRTDGYQLPAGESWAEQRKLAESILAGYPATASPSQDLRGTAIESATVDPAGTTMVVTFTGVPDPAASPCGADYAAEAVESAEAVVVIILEQRHAYDEICTGLGMTRTATLHLSQPLADRAVLDLPQSPPITVSAAPSPS